MISKKKNYIRPIKRVYQKHKTGCGVACVGMILGLSYGEAMQVVHPKRKPGKKPYTSMKRIAEVFRNYKIKFKIHIPNGHKLKTIKNPCILGVRHDRDAGKGIFPTSWHWVVFNKKIMDPYKKGGSYSLKYCQKNTFFIFEILKLNNSAL